MTESMTFGLVGMGGRGRSLKHAFDAHSKVDVTAVCDPDEEAAEFGRELFDVNAAYAAYDEMLREADLDAVVIGTPAPYHVPQSMAALDRDLHVLSEVPAGVSVAECRDLVLASADSSGTYLMTENFMYLRSNQIVSEMVDAGLFGNVYYAEAEYLHELRALNERTPWRRNWQTGIDGITYPTHCLGPTLQWMDDDRIQRVTCAGSGHHHRDHRGNQYEQEDTTVMLAETERGNLIRVRQDMLSDRPDGIDNYAFQGTTGCYESARKGEEKDAVWLKEREEAENSREYEWVNLETFAPEYLPDVWEEIPHGFPEDTDNGSDDDGGLAFRNRVLIADYVMMVEFLGVLTNGDAPPIAIHDAMDMTLPGLVSQQSIEADGRWMTVPDSRDWV